MAIRARPMSELLKAINSRPNPKVQDGVFESHMTPLVAEPADPRRMVVDLEGDQSADDAVANGGSLLVDLDAGTVGAQPADAQASNRGAFNEPVGGYDHYENVALRMEQNDLQRIGQMVHEAVLDDIKSREEWEALLGQGTKMLTSGEIADLKDLAQPMKIVQHIKHPIFAIAVYQYQTRAYKQLLPPGGPVKGQVVGQRTEEKTQRSERVADYMNYQMTVEDAPYADQTDKLLLVQSIDGSTFRKVYRDHLLKRNVGRYVRAVDVIVPYSAESLDDALRITHRYRENAGDVHRKMLSPDTGYRAVQLGEPPPAGEASQGSGQVSEVQRATDAVQGLAPSGQHLTDDGAEYTFYEQQVYLDLNEHVDENQQPTGIPLPYVVTIESETQEVVCIWRDWDEEDDQQRRLPHFAHYKFLPGPGFYGLGYSHLLCGLAAGVTASLRILLVGAMFASASGGFVTKDSGGKLPSSVSLEPGVFKAIDATLDELSKAFYSPDFKEPSQALPNGIEMLLKAAERLSSTVEAMVGDGPTTGPVGTTLAMIEQSGELYSGIHQRNHRAMRDELRMRFRLNSIPDYQPEGGYPYSTGAKSGQAMAEDFNEEHVDVWPVSDPNIFSSQQRIALAQAVLQIAEAHPDQWSVKVALRRMAEALRVPDPDELEVKQAEAQPFDPITENAMAFHGLPIAAGLEQDHDAHNLVHGSVLQDPNTPDPVKARLAAHMSDHMAKKLQAQAVAAGIPIAQINTQPENGQPAAQPIDPRLERVISTRAAALVQQQAQQRAQAQPNPQAAEADSKHKARMAEVAGTLKIRSAESQGKLAIARQEMMGRMGLERIREQHRQRLTGAQEGFNQRLKAHQQVMADATATPQAKDESQAGVDAAAQEITRAMDAMVSAVEALAKQMADETDKIIAAVGQEEQTEGANA